MIRAQPAQEQVKVLTAILSEDPSQQVFYRSNRDPNGKWSRWTGKLPQFELYEYMVESNQAVVFNLDDRTWRLGHPDMEPGENCIVVRSNPNGHKIVAKGSRVSLNFNAPKFGLVDRSAVSAVSGIPLGSLVGHSQTEIIASLKKHFTGDLFRSASYAKASGALRFTFSYEERKKKREYRLFIPTKNGWVLVSTQKVDVIAAGRMQHPTSYIGGAKNGDVIHVDNVPFMLIKAVANGR